METVNSHITSPPDTCPSEPQRDRTTAQIKLAIDIDDTLSLTAHHWAELLLKIHPLPGRSVDELIATHRRASMVPEWQHAQALFTEWRLSEELTLEYQPVPGSVEGIQALEKVIKLEYLTMRSQSLDAVTARWLKSFNYPESAIVSCPDEIESPKRPDWKATHLYESYPSIIGIIEDDERVAMSLPSDYKGSVFLYSHHEAPRSDIRIIPCPTWKDVTIAVEYEVARERIRQPAV